MAEATLENLAEDAVDNIQAFFPIHSLSNHFRLDERSSALPGIMCVMFWFSRVLSLSLTPHVLRGCSSCVSTISSFDAHSVGCIKDVFPLYVV